MIKYIKINLLLIVVLFSSCGKVSTPRPYGFFRVDLPEFKHTRIEAEQLPYSFEMSDFATLKIYDSPNEKFWIDLLYPQLNATIYCSYFNINKNLLTLSEESRQLVYQHSIKADGISESVFNDAENNVYGILYQLKGNTASTVQFVITDSVKHFFRGALYFDNVPNKDSIAPMADYIQKDIVRLMESFRWKK